MKLDFKELDNVKQITIGASKLFYESGVKVISGRPHEIPMLTLTIIRLVQLDLLRRNVY